MQVKIFPITAPDQEVNDFLSGHSVVENGIIVRENQIIILYQPEVPEEESKLKKLNNTLKFFREQFIGESINYAYYLKLEMLGKGDMQLGKQVDTPMGPQTVKSTVSQELTQARATVESLKVQILTLEEMIATPPTVPTAADEPKVFNQKQYTKKDKKQVK